VPLESIKTPDLFLVLCARVIFSRDCKNVGNAGVEIKMALKTQKISRKEKGNLLDVFSEDHYNIEKNSKAKEELSVCKKI
jgi:DNA-binding XRE family transcriptional regulator